MPNHVWLGGYQSIKMQYDGTLARWRPMSSLLIASSYKSRLDKGFFGGGGTPIALSSVEKIDYPTETRQTSFSNTITSATDSIASAGNADKGFYNCIGTPRTTANKISYSDESISAVAGANLSQGRYAAGGAGNADKGFFIGGAVTTPAYTGLTTADRTNYSTETTAAVSGANLSQARGYPQSVGNSDKGFFSGGLGAGGTTYLATADRTNYSTETTAAVSGANLPQNRYGGGTAGNVDKGFISGGATPTAPTVTFLSSTIKTTYSTETVATVSSANLSQARFGLSAAGNENKGFFAGGNTPTIVATADRTTYASETTAAAAGANLGTARIYSSAV